MGAPQLELMINPQEFFREKVVEAVQNQQVTIGDELEFYLVNLLCEFINPTKVDTLVGEIDAMQTPLALMLKQALESPPSQRLRIFKYLGDTSLYFAGFFQDYFNRKTFDVNYYIDLGTSAYANVSTIMRDHHGDEHFTSMYKGLAQKFQCLVEIVAEVSEAGSEKPADLLSVYDRWTRSNSDRLRRILAKNGIIPLPTPSRDKQ